MLESFIGSLKKQSDTPLVKQNLSLMIVICVVSLSIELFNTLVTQYPGILYIPFSAINLLGVVLLLHFGFHISFDGKGHYLSNLTYNFGLFLLALWVLAQFTNAIQLTPFKTIDPILYRADRIMGINLTNFVIFTNQFPSFKFLLQLAYSALNYELVSLPILLIICKHYQHFLKTLCLLLTTSLFGFMLYYFFPSTGPATLLKLPIFMEEQFATGLKFYQIHHHQLASTMHGGLIAFPSFHVIWALVCLYAARPFKRFYLYQLIMIINAFLIIACFLLGWHYLIDIIGGIALFAIILFLIEKQDAN